MSNIDRDVDYSNATNAIKFILAQWWRDIRTTIPAHIVEYDAKTRRASVQPAVDFLTSRLPDDTTAKSIESRRLKRPVIKNLPVVQPSTGLGSILMPIKEGDAVLLCFTERGIEQFKKNFERSVPGAIMPMDGAVVPGFGPIEVTPADEEAISVQENEGKTYIAVKDGNVTIISTGDISTESEGDTRIKAEGDISTESAGDTRIKSDSNITVICGGNVSITSTGNVSITSTGNVSINSGGDMTVQSAGKLTLNSATMEINTGRLDIKRA